ncbi:unnamed protein product, partial [Aphanomyces euteiches]
EYMTNGLGDAGLSNSMSKYFPGLTGTREVSTKKKIQAWYRNRESIEQKAVNPASANMMNTRQLGQATVLDIAAERRIVEWIVERRLEDIPICNLLLQQYALPIAKD